MPQYGAPPVQGGYVYQEPPPVYRAPPPVYQELPPVYRAVPQPPPRVYYEHAPPAVYGEYVPPAVVPVPGPYYVPPRRVYVHPGYLGYGAYGYRHGFAYGPRRW